MKEYEKLPWTDFTWVASSFRADGSRINLIGEVEFEQRPDEIILRARCAGRAACMASELGVAWDPFNICMTIVPSRSSAI